jgi:hypothetical protein
MSSRRGGLADPGTNCSIHRFLKGNPEFPARAVSRVPRGIERQGRPHLAIIYPQVGADLGRPPPDFISPDPAGPRDHLRKWS